MCASDVFIRESSTGAAQVPEDCIIGYSMKDELDTLVSALRKLGETFPVACEFVFHSLPSMRDYALL